MRGTPAFFPLPTNLFALLGRIAKGATAAISLTNSVRDLTPSLSIKLARWVSMVRTLSLNSSAIILLVFPVMMRSATLRSAG